MQEELNQQDVPDVAARNTLFSPGSWQAKIDVISHLVLFNNLLITVLAEKEGGKSSFIRLLQDKLDPQIRACAISVAPHCNPYTLIETIAEKLSVKRNNAEQMNLEEVVDQINETKKPVLLLIDNAQYLPVILVKEMLDAIKNQHENAFFHVCLISDYSVVAIYNQLTRETANSIHTLELGVLNELELKTYVTQKLAGDKHAIKWLTESQLNQLYKMTGGCLSKINVWLHTIRMESASVSARKNQNALPRSIALAMLGVFLLSSLSAGIFFRADITEYLQRVSGKKVEEVAMDTPLKSEIPWFREQALHQLVYEGLPKKEMVSSLDDDEENAINLQEAVVDQVMVIPKIKFNEADFQRSQEEGSSIVSELHDSLAEQEQIMESTIAKIPESSEYTIQLIASHALSDIERFAREYKLQGKSTVRQVIRDEDSWYILTVGEYDDAEQAQDALQKLSGELLKYKPWVRLTSNLKMVG